MALEQQAPQEDEYARGMTSWQPDDDKYIERYTTWQTNQIWPHLGDYVLEIGAGAGRISVNLLKRREFSRYTALEPSPYFFKYLQEHCPGIETLNCTLDGLDTSRFFQYDTVFSVHVMEHIYDDLGFLKLVDRFLKPGGKLVILVPAFPCLMSELDRRIGHRRRYTRRSVNDLFNRLGYKRLACRYFNFLGFWGWLWFCRVRRKHYQQPKEKSGFMRLFSVYSSVILPFSEKLERLVSVPVGLNLTAVYRKPSSTISG